MSKYYIKRLTVKQTSVHISCFIDSLTDTYKQTNKQYDQIHCSFRRFPGFRRSEAPVLRVPGGSGVHRSRGVHRSSRLLRLQRVHRSARLLPLHVRLTIRVLPPPLSD